MQQSIELTIKMENAEFKNIMPRDIDDELYFLRINACDKPEVETQREKFTDFVKTTFKVMILLNELKKNKRVVVGLYRARIGEVKFLGDFEINLTG